MNGQNKKDIISKKIFIQERHLFSKELEHIENMVF